MNRLSSIPSSTLNRLEQQPAEVQSAKRTLQQSEQIIEQALIRSKTDQKLISEALAEVHKNETWRQSGAKSFVEWIESRWGKSKSWAYQKMREFAENQLESKELFQLKEKYDDNKVLAQEAPRSDTSKGGSIDTVAAPDKSTKNATHNNGSGAERNETAPAAVVKPRDNGKPIFALPIWMAMEEDFGYLLNRVDVLNRFCPNFHFHNDLLSSTKRCMDILRTWKEYAKNGKMATTSPSL